MISTEIPVIRDTISSEKIQEDGNDDNHTLLHNKYSFWFHKRGQKSGNTYEDSILKIATCHSVESFWSIYDHLIRPNDIKSSTDYHFFKDGIKPTWEDAYNKNGGKWMIKVKKGLTSWYWEELILAIIGEQFDVGHEICGAVVSIRTENDIISVWNKTADNSEAMNKIRDQMRRILKLPPTVTIEYKKHVESLHDNSSYRNPTVVWRAPTKEERATINRDGNLSNNTSPRGNFNRNEGISPRGTSRWDALKSDSNNANKEASGSGDRTWKSSYSNRSPRGDSHNSWKPSSTEASSSEQHENTPTEDNPQPVDVSKSRNITGWVKSQFSKAQGSNIQDNNTQEKVAWGQPK